MYLFDRQLDDEAAAGAIRGIEKEAAPEVVDVAAGEGQAETIRLDLAAQRAAGLVSDYADVILEKIG